MLTWIATIAAVLAIVVGAGIWRLMTGPIELDSLLPYVQTAFARAGLAITMSAVRIGIDPASHQLDLHVENARLALPDGEKLGDFPELTAGFGIVSLLRGRPVPNRIMLERPVVRLRRDRSGKIRLRIGNTETPAPGAGALAIGPAQAEAPLGFLDRLSIVDATVIVDDRRLGRHWRVDHLNLTVAREAAGSGGNLSLALAIGGRTATFEAAFRYRTDRRTLDLKLTAQHAEPAALAPLAPALQPLADLHLPVSGTMHTRFDFAAGNFDALHLDLGFGAGWVNNTQFAGGRLAVSGGELHAVYTRGTGTLRVDKLAVDLGGGARVVAHGEATGLSLEPSDGATTGIPVRFALDVTDAPVAKIGGWWPPALSPNARRWVLANLRAGVLDEAAARFALTIDPAHGSATLTAADGTLRYHGVAVDYLAGLPPAKNVAGTAKFTADRFEIDPSGATLERLKMSGGVVRIADLAKPVPTLTADLTLTGPLRDALDIATARKLGDAAAWIDPTAFGGRVDARVHFGFPLAAALKLRDVDLSGTAALDGVTIAGVALGHNLDNGSFTLALARTGVAAQGEARFAGVPARIDASVSFAPANGPRAICHAALTLDDAARKRLDLGFAPDLLSGPVAMALTYTVQDDARSAATLALDLRGARLAVSQAGWEKPAGRPGAARIDIPLARQAIAGALRVAIQANGLDGKFAVALSPDRARIDRVDIARLAVGGDDVSGSVVRRGNGWRADIRGPRFDLHPLLSRAIAKDAAPSPPLTIAARLDRVALGPGRLLHNVAATLSRAGGVWQSMTIDGTYANGRALSIRLGGAAGPGRLAVTSDDLGAALRLLDIADNVVGGNLAVTGRLGEANDTPTLQARIAGADFNVVRTPLAARILSLASVSGFSSTLSGTGIPFSTLRGGLSYTSAGVTLDRLAVYGEALGVIASGKVDLDRDTLALSGTIAPLHALNSMFGKVPVIGALLMGGKGQSLFAANYRLAGPIADPTVSVDPISAIAPGILRRLFDPDLLTGTP